MDTFNNRTAAKLLCVITAVLCCLMSMTFYTSAAATDTVTLTANSGGATITLNYPQAAAEKASSVQISLKISGSANVEFVPDSNLAAKIVESRYHGDTGILNIYLAGTNALFPISGVITLGSVEITSGSGSATIGIVADSIKFVRGSELVSYPGSAGIALQPSDDKPTQSGSSSSPQPSTPVSSSQTSTSSQTPTQQPTQSSTSGSADQGPIIDNFNPPDTSALSAALAKASSYNRGDYTESSYAVLTQAIDNANSLLSDQYATQDMIDEALLVLENAIGTLTLSNDIPSGADSNDKNSGDNVSDGGNVNSDGTDDNLSADSADDNQNNQTGSGTSDNESHSSEGEDGNSGKPSAVLVIVIVAVVVIIAAAAIVLFLRSNKKRS